MHKVCLSKSKETFDIFLENMDVRNYLLMFLYLNKDELLCSLRAHFFFPLLEQKMKMLISEPHNEYKINKKK